MNKNEKIVASLFGVFLSTFCVLFYKQYKMSQKALFDDSDIILASEAKIKKKQIPVTLYVLKNDDGKNYLLTNQNKKSKIVKLKKIHSISRNGQTVELIYNDKNKRKYITFNSKEEADEFITRFIKLTAISE